MISAGYSLQVELPTIPSWEEFVEKAVTYTIALDGKVKAPTQEDIRISVSDVFCCSPRNVGSRLSEETVEEILALADLGRD
jgi:hypothetical protein